MVTRLIEQVEGEATLLLGKEPSGRIAEAKILFPHFRGMEKILERKEALDALALTPRVCGICGHAHLMATVGALESCYEKAGYALTVSEKARAIRTITLSLEMVQNHFKWFFLVLLPSTPGFRYERDASILAAHRAAAACARAIAHLAGQWPHTSYALPGGVMCDPTHLELLQAESAVEEAIALFGRLLFAAGVEKLAEAQDVTALTQAEGALPELLRHLRDRGLMEVGRSHDRFLTLCDHALGSAGKSLRTRLASVDTEQVEEDEPLGEEGYANYAKPVRYKGRFYETGPLARAMVSKVPLILKMHRRYKDAASTRIAARMREAAALLRTCRDLLRSIDLAQPSYIEPPVPLGRLDGVRGRGVVEAARGSLMHSVHLRKGRIVRYCIVTPTQWNLANGTSSEPGVAQRAIVGLSDEELAEFVFKSFDVCSVCTTQ